MAIFIEAQGLTACEVDLLHYAVPSCKMLDAFLLRRVA